MFDLITGTGERPLRERSVTSKVVAVATHVVVIVVVIAIPLLRSHQPTARVADDEGLRRRAVGAAATSAATASPAGGSTRGCEAGRQRRDNLRPRSTRPSAIEPERLSARDESIAGALGRSRGGSAGRSRRRRRGRHPVVRGTAAASPPPPPPAPATRAPVRIGGQITAPALLHRVEPMLSRRRVQVAQLSGIVILEAVVGTDGCVESVRILRSRHLLLDKASEEALLQWRYSPLVLNGIPTPFVLTVTFNFSVQK